MVETITGEGQRKAKSTQPIGTGKKREKASPFRGQKLFHPQPF